MIVVLSCVLLLLSLSCPVVKPQVPNYVILKCDFHVHTTYSDGNLTPTETVDYYKNAGYDVIAITDHNKIWGCAEAKAEGNRVGLIVVQGEEISTAWNGTLNIPKHVLGLFLTGNIPWNESWLFTSKIKGICDVIHNLGGLAVVAHPWLSWNNISYSMGWEAWGKYMGAPFIDGYEFVAKVPTYKGYNYYSWLLSSNSLFLRNHDFHCPQNLQSSFTLLLAYNNTEAEVREALLSHRVVVKDEGVWLGLNSGMVW